MSTKVSVIIIILLVLAALAYYLSPYKDQTPTNPILQKVRENFVKLNPKYGKIPLQEGDSAYTENKSVITLCLKEPGTGKYYGINTIMYVALHELSHMITTSQGHGDDFKDNFADLLKEATFKGIYDPRMPIPNKYCGVES